MILTQEQESIVASTSGHLVVFAGPGSGKTRVVTEKIIRIFETGAIPEPYGLLAITFTNAAANEMRSRLRSSGFRYWDRVWTGTFHAFGAYLLTCYGSDVGVREDFEVIDADMRLKELEQIAANTLRGVTAQDLGRAIENLKRQGIYPDRSEHRIPASLQPAYRAYQVRLRELNCVDFGDLVALPLRLLVESPLPSRIFKTYFRYILADEFQDTDAQQLELVCLLSQSALGSTVVADDDQSIYRFRGAHRQNIYEIERRLGATRCILGANFRSDQVIVEAAQAVMAGDRDRATKALKATSVERGRLFFHQFMTPRDEAAQVAAWISEAITTGKVSDPGEICLVCRARWRMQDTIAQLSAVGIPWFDRSRLGFEDSLETSLGLATLSLACSPDSSDALFDLISAVESGGLAYRLGEVDALDVAVEVRRRVKSSQTGICSPSTAAEVLEIAGVQDILGQVAWSQTEARRMSRNLNLMARDLLAETQTSHIQLMEAVRRLRGVGAVQVMSGHEVKGLEFDQVFLIGLEDDVLPNYRAKTEEDISEERRILYVGLTRTRHCAYLTCAANRQTRSGNWQSKSVSRFLKNMPPEYWSPLSF